MISKLSHNGLFLLLFCHNHNYIEMQKAMNKFVLFRRFHANFMHGDGFVSGDFV